MNDPQSSNVTATQDNRSIVGQRHLWAPWRISYIGSGSPERGCVFCNRLAAEDDVESLIIWRDSQIFALLNLYPYNTGHLMLVPNEHVASPELLSAQTAHQLADLLKPSLRAIRRALSCDGFNIGMNIGESAGAGIASHLHQHVVPRWSGDANFMPTTAGVKVMPELLPITYAKLRAELSFEAGGIPELSILAIDRSRTRIVVEPEGISVRLPRLSRSANEPAWHSAQQLLADRGIVSTLAGWAGSRRAEMGEAAVLAFEGEIPQHLDDRIREIPIDQALVAIQEQDERAAIERFVNEPTDTHDSMRRSP
jgi:ATP adenylyltransferase